MASPFKGSLSLSYKWLIYRIYLRPNCFISLWEQDLKFTEEQVQKVIRLVHEVSISNKYPELNYKLLTRVYHTPKRLARISYQLHVGDVERRWELYFTFSGHVEAFLGIGQS